MDIETVNRADQIAALTRIRRRLTLAQASVDLLLSGLLNGRMPVEPEPEEHVVGNGNGNGAGAPTDNVTLS